jgi:hypothetical protein
MVHRFDVARGIADVVVGEDDLFAAGECDAGMDAVHFAVEVTVLRIDRDVRADRAPGLVMRLEHGAGRAVDDQDLTAGGIQASKVVCESFDLAGIGARAPDRQEISAPRGHVQASACSALG